MNRVILILLSNFLFLNVAFSQRVTPSNYKLDRITFGPKLGFQTFQARYRFDEDTLGFDIKERLKVGFNLGGVMNYEVNETFSMVLELYYSREGKLQKGGIDGRLSNNAVYHMLRAPILIRMSWPPTPRSKRVYTWYVNMGGNFSYWLAGRGVIKSIELDEFNIEKNRYIVGFKEGDKTEKNGKLLVNIEEPNRIHVGLDIGVGAIFPLVNRQQLVTELRLTIGHSFHGKDTQADIGLAEYFENYRFANRVINFSVAYLYEYHRGEQRRGKTTIKRRNRRR